MTDSLRVFVNGTGVSVPPGSTVIDAVQAVDPAAGAEVRAGTRAVADSTTKLDSFAARLESVSFHSVLKRGYALVRDSAGTPLVSVAGASPGAAIQVEFADGKVDARVEGGGAKSQTRSARKPNPGQGTLL